MNKKPLSFSERFGSYNCNPELFLWDNIRDEIDFTSSPSPVPVSETCFLEDDLAKPCSFADMGVNPGNTYLFKPLFCETVVTERDFMSDLLGGDSSIDFSDLDDEDLQGLNEDSDAEVERSLMSCLEEITNTVRSIEASKPKAKEAEPELKFRRIKTTDEVKETVMVKNECMKEQHVENPVKSLKECYVSLVNLKKMDKDRLCVKCRKVYKLQQHLKINLKPPRKKKKTNIKILEKVKKDIASRAMTSKNLSASELLAKWGLSTDRKEKHSTSREKKKSGDAKKPDLISSKNYSPRKGPNNANVQNTNDNKRKLDSGRAGTVNVVSGRKLSIKPEQGLVMKSWDMFTGAIVDQKVTVQSKPKPSSKLKFTPTSKGSGVDHVRSKDKLVTCKNQQHIDRRQATDTSKVNRSRNISKPIKDRKPDKFRPSQTLHKEQDIRKVEFKEEKPAVEKPNTEVKLLSASGSISDVKDDCNKVDDFKPSGAIDTVKKVRFSGNTSVAGAPVSKQLLNKQFTNKPASTTGNSSFRNVAQVTESITESKHEKDDSSRSTGQSPIKQTQQNSDNTKSIVVGRVHDITHGMGSNLGLYGREARNTKGFDIPSMNKLKLPVDIESPMKYDSSSSFVHVPGRSVKDSMPSQTEGSSNLDKLIAILRPLQTPVLGQQDGNSQPHPATPQCSLAQPSNKTGGWNLSTVSPQTLCIVDKPTTPREPTIAQGLQTRKPKGTEEVHVDPRLDKNGRPTTRRVILPCDLPLPKYRHIYVYKTAPVVWEPHARSTEKDLRTSNKSPNTEEEMFTSSYVRNLINKAVENPREASKKVDDDSKQHKCNMQKIRADKVKAKLSMLLMSNALKTDVNPRSVSGMDNSDSGSPNDPGTSSGSGSDARGRLNSCKSGRVQFGKTLSKLDPQLIADESVEEHCNTGPQSDAFPVGHPKLPSAPLTDQRTCIYPSDGDLEHDLIGLRDNKIVTDMDIDDNTGSSSERVGTADVETKPVIKSILPVFGGTMKHCDADTQSPVYFTIDDSESDDDRGADAGVTDSCKATGSNLLNAPILPTKESLSTMVSRWCTENLMGSRGGNKRSRSPTDDSKCSTSAVTNKERSRRSVSPVVENSFGRHSRTSSENNPPNRRSRSPGENRSHRRHSRSPTRDRRRERSSFGDDARASQRRSRGHVTWARSRSIPSVIDMSADTLDCIQPDRTSQDRRSRSPVGFPTQYDHNDWRVHTNTGRRSPVSVHSRDYRPLQDNNTLSEDRHSLRNTPWSRLGPPNREQVGGRFSPPVPDSIPGREGGSVFDRIGGINRNQTIFDMDAVDNPETWGVN